MNEVDQSTTTAVSAPPRRRKRLVLGLLAALILTMVALVLYLYYASDRELREVIAETDRLDPGWQLEAIEAHRAQVPDAENAALVVLQVKALLPANWPLQPVPAGLAEPEDAPGAAGARPEQTWLDRLYGLPPEAQLPAPPLRRLQASLAQVEPARIEARRLIGMTRGRFPLDWPENVYETKLQSPAARSAATLLRCEATLAAQEGDADGALAFVRGMVGTARSVGDEPLLLSALLRLACDAQAVAALERALAQGEPSARELEAVQTLLEREATEPLFLQALRGERAGLHQLLLALRDGRASLSQIAGSRAGLERAAVELAGPTLARRSHARMLRLLNEHVEASRRPPEEQPPLLKDLQRQIIQAKLDYDVVTALLMPAMIKVGDAYRRGVGNLRCAAVAVALERYRRDQGQWPEKLEALVPKYLAAVPTDPQDGKPLRYRRRPDGVVVYWLGPDGTDDGGKLERHNYLAQGTDQGVQLWDVKQRRQPPPAAPAPGTGDK
jgi:hypothetical protein